MSDLRAMIRELLGEEIAALRAEMLGGAEVERVAVASPADLTDFARSIARRAQEPGFLAALEAGRIRFAPDTAPVTAPATVPVPARSPQLPAAAPPQPTRLVTTVPAGVPELGKALVTERDIAAIAAGETRLRIPRTARVTPLAGDEARRRGIRIERTLA